MSFLLLASRSVAKKSRTPPPPRRPVQAPKRRTRNDPASADDARKARALMLFAAAGIVGLAVVVAVIFLTSGKSKNKPNSASVAAAMRAAGCTYQDVPVPKPPNGQTTHIATLASPVNWNTYPPAGGQHYGQWAVWGFYTEPVDPKQVVHNEEHGGVVMWWGPKTPKAEIEKMRAFYSSSPNSMFGTPVGTIKGKSLGSKVAITAWTGDPKTYQLKGDFGTAHVAICPTFNESAFKTFRDAFRGKGPEGVPTSANDPGLGP
jgi:hypothetical protein